MPANFYFGKSARNNKNVVIILVKAALYLPKNKMLFVTVVTHIFFTL
jgi:hypothetical protein